MTLLNFLMCKNPRAGRSLFLPYSLPHFFIGSLLTSPLHTTLTTSPLHIVCTSPPHTPLTYFTSSHTPYYLTPSHTPSLPHLFMGFLHSFTPTRAGCRSHCVFVRSNRHSRSPEGKTSRRNK